MEVLILYKIMIMGPVMEERDMECLIIRFLSAIGVHIINLTVARPEWETTLVHIAIGDVNRPVRWKTIYGCIQGRSHSDVQLKVVG